MMIVFGSLHYIIPNSTLKLNRGQSVYTKYTKHKLSLFTDH